MLPDGAAYAQRKLTLTMWSRRKGLSLRDNGPAIIAVNPGSMLGSKMVRKAHGVAGGDLLVGAEITCRAALDEEFAAAYGEYFDNDSGRFSSPREKEMVGTGGFEPPTPRTPSVCATRLRHVPTGLL